MPKDLGFIFNRTDLNDQEEELSSEVWASPHSVVLSYDVAPVLTSFHSYWRRKQNHNSTQCNSQQGLHIGLWVVCQLFCHDDVACSDHRCLCVQASGGSGCSTEVPANNFATIRTTSIVRQEIKQHAHSNEYRNFTVYKRLRKQHQKELQSVSLHWWFFCGVSKLHLFVAKHYKATCTCVKKMGASWFQINSELLNLVVCISLFKKITNLYSLIWNMYDYKCVCVCVCVCGGGGREGGRVSVCSRCGCALMYLYWCIFLQGVREAFV